MNWIWKTMKLSRLYFDKKRNKTCREQTIPKFWKTTHGPGVARCCQIFVQTLRTPVPFSQNWRWFAFSLSLSFSFSSSPIIDHTVLVHFREWKAETEPPISQSRLWMEVFNKTFWQTSQINMIDFQSALQ